MSSILDNKRLYTWNEGKKKEIIKKKGVPRTVDTLLINELGLVSSDGSAIKYPGEWSGYISELHGYPPTGEHAFPKEIYFEVPASYKITFDFMSTSRNTRIVSGAMLELLKDHGLTDYEIAKANVISRKWKPIETEKQYFVLWFYKFDDDLLEFGNAITVTQESYLGMKPLSYDLYPNMQIKKGVDKKIFSLDHFTFQEAFVFNEEIKDLIEKKGFIGPDIYAMEELWRAYVDEKPE